MKLPYLMLAAVAALAPATALAQTGDAPPPGAFPLMATMDRTGDHSSFDSSLAWGFFDSNTFDVDVGLRIDLSGQYVAEQGWGLYGALPVSYLSANNTSETAVGNLEVGGTYQVPVGQFPLLLRGGLMIDTADDNLEGVITNAINGYSRLTDLVSSGANITWLRVAASPLIRQGQLFLRGDVGFDVPLDKPDGSNVDPLIRLNIGGGIQTGQLTVAGELVTLGTTGDVADGEDRFVSTAAATVGFDAGTVQPFGALIVPIDSQINDIVNFYLMAGLRVPLGR